MRYSLSVQSDISNALLKIVPLGGLGHIGGNLMVYETSQDIVVIDCGVLFPHSEQPGIDYVIPDVQYLENRKHKLRAYIITHGHEDHIGALPFILQSLPAPVYAHTFARLLIAQKLKEYPNVDVPLRPMPDARRFTLGDFEIQPIAVTHSIPDSQALALHTPAGVVIHTGDFRLDHEPYDHRPTDAETFKYYGDLGVSLLVSDSTNALVEGHSESERSIEDTLGHLIQESQGRVVFTTFSSHIERIQSICRHAVRNHRLVCFAGRSMQQNTTIAREHGYLEIDKQYIIDVRDAADVPPQELLVIASGSQGEPQSAMGRLVSGRLFGIPIHKNDRIILSSRRIPGNERAIGRIVDGLLRLGAEVIDDSHPHVHTSGHACRDEQTEMLHWCRPEYFIPMHGQLRHLVAHAKLAQACGVAPDKCLVIEDGQPVAFEEEQQQLKAIRQQPVPAGLVLVDGTGIGDIDQLLLEERISLGSNGIVLIAVVLDDARHVVAGPLVRSRGVVERSKHQHWMKELTHTLTFALHRYRPNTELPISHCNAQLESLLRKATLKFFQIELSRAPVVFPLIAHLPENCCAS